MVFAPIAHHIEMGFERIDLIAEKVKNLPYYKKLFVDCYGDEQITPQRMRESLGQFLFSIVSNNTKFDDAIVKGFTNFTTSELNGRQLFITNRCNTCHFISKNFNSSYGNGGLKLANIGLDESDADVGNNGVYKIPRLKNISKTAPYMHDGRFKTLEEVLEHYSHNIKPNPKLNSILMDFSTGTGKPKQFNLSEFEKRDLIAFLKTLDDKVLTSDVKFSSPFID
jgi:cytochrome c peroxidase